MRESLQNGKIEFNRCMSPGTHLFPVLLKFSLYGGVPVIFDIVVRATWQLFGDVCPPISMVFVHCNQNRFFVVRPLSLFQFRV